MGITEDQYEVSEVVPDDFQDSETGDVEIMDETSVTEEYSEIPVGSEKQTLTDGENMELTDGTGMLNIIQPQEEIWMTTEESGNVSDDLMSSGRLFRLYSSGSVSYSEDFYGSQISNYGREIYNAMYNAWINGGTGEFYVTFQDKPVFTATGSVNESGTWSWTGQKNDQEYRALVYSMVQNALDSFVYDYPDVYWLSYIKFSAVPVFSENEDGTVSGTISTMRIVGAEKWLGASKSVSMYQSYRDEAVASCFSGIDDSMTTAEKLKVIHDFICTYASKGNENSAYAHSSYGVFVNRSAVCEGYAKAFKVLCDLAGIPCVLVSGDSVKNSAGDTEPHMWNEVLINGNWYAIDTTADDRTGDISYVYFLNGKNSPGFYRNSFAEEKTYYSKFSGSDVAPEFIIPSISSDMYHEWNIIGQTQGDCKTEGSIAFKCILCGDTKSETTGKTGHTASDWKVIKEATDTENGLKEKICTSCGKKLETRETLAYSKRIFKTESSDVSMKYTGSELKPSVSVTFNGETVSGDSYDISYIDNILPGIAAISVTGKNDYEGFKGTAYFRILPKDTTLISANGEVGKINIEWSKIDHADGYMIQVSDSSSFGKIQRQKTIYNGSETAYTMTGISSGTWYVRINAFKTASKEGVSGTRSYSGWSNIIETTVKDIAKPSDPKISSSISNANNTLDIKWSKSNDAEGYMIQISNTTDFKKIIKQSTVYGATNYKMTNVPGGNYYVRVTAFKTHQDGSVSKRVYSNWSSDKYTSVKSAYTQDGFKLVMVHTYTDYTGKNTKPAVNVYVNGGKIPSGLFDLAYTNDKEPGLGFVTATGKGIWEGYSGKTAFRVIPPASEIKSLSSNGRSVTLSWTKSYGADGYMIQISKDKNFKSYRQMTVRNGEAVSAAINNVASGTYYARIKSYVEVSDPTLSGTRGYSAWKIFSGAVSIR